MFSEHHTNLTGSDISVALENVSKYYKIYNQPLDRIKDLVLRRRSYRQFWALRNVSLNFKKGEIVGIVGKNGSGKSTLLQLICGTLTPSQGRISTAGKIAALLELGTGFNPEFTGRENVYLNAGLLGMNSRQIDACYGEIVAFAELEEFIEQPIRTYSSGMLVRLAFAVATCSTPEILIIDEALAVGDERFQRKCYARIRDLQDQGVTILFVSHASQHILQLCQRAVLLDRGEVLAVHQPKLIIGYYQKLTYASSQQRQQVRDEIQATLAPSASVAATAREPGANDQASAQQRDWLDPALVSSSRIAFEQAGASIGPVTIHNQSGDMVNHLRRGERYICRYDVQFEQDTEGVHCSLMLKTTSGFHLGGYKTAPHGFDTAARCCKQGSRLRVEFNLDCRLNPGLYYLNAAVFGNRDTEQHILCRIIDVTLFRVIDEDTPCHVGLVNLIDSSQVIELAAQAGAQP